MYIINGYMRVAIAVLQRPIEQVHRLAVVGDNTADEVQVGAQPALFDYTALPDATALDLRMAAERIRMRLKRSAEDIIAIGQDLITAKTLISHGQFGAWLTSEFEMSYPTAVRFMQVAERFGDKSINLIDFNPSILYALAAPATPAEVADEVVARVASGEIAPTVADVKQAIADAKLAQSARATARQ